jgi:FkbM family methyltransferase
VTRRDQTRPGRIELWSVLCLAVIVLGVLGPWTRQHGLHVNGARDAILVILAVSAAFALVIYRLTANPLAAAFVLVTGVTTFVLATVDAHDPLGPLGGPGRNVHSGWGLWAALVGSVGLIAASVVLIRNSERRRKTAIAEAAGYRAQILNPALAGPTRQGLVRAQQTRMALRAAEKARRTARAAAARERDFRREFARVAGRVSPYVAVEIGGLTYVLPARQKFGLGRFADLDWKEHRHLERALTFLRTAGVAYRNTTFVDVGANVGTTIVPAVAQLGFARGVAIEPEPENLRLLRVNLAANGLDDTVRVVEAAASNREGRAELVLRPQSGGKHHLRQDKPAHSGAIDVAGITIDSLVRDALLDPGDVGLLWLDIQGHELEALEGARMLLERRVPVVMEFDTRELDPPRLHALRDVLADYTGVVDLSLPGREQTPVPLDELERVAERHAGTFTDLLVVRI